MALFCKHYPGLWCNAAWPTADHIVPWNVYEALLGQLPAVELLDRIAGGHAIETGIGLAFPADAFGARMLIDRLLDEALGPEPPEGRPTYF